MRKAILLSISVVLAFILPFMLKAQTIVFRGTIRNSATGESLQNATISIKGVPASVTDSNGNFRITSNKSLPVKITATHTGFENSEIMVMVASDNISLQLNPVVTQLGEVRVIGPNKVLTKLTESSTSIEQYGYKQIANAAASDYYSMALGKKGVDNVTSSLTFKTISTRGFNGSGSARVNQLVDGMDNQAPGLNFFVGNFVGLTELDVESVEILPGASSALYGPGGMNGTVLINSKSPFEFQGLNILAKQGVMHVDKRQRENASPFYDYSLRWAKTFKNKFAIKIGAQYISAKDWLASDTSNYSRTGNIGKLIPGNRKTDPNYDGVNVYGDETSLNMVEVTNAVLGYATQQFQQSFYNATSTNPSQAQINGFLSSNPQTAPFYLGKNAGLIPDQNVSRTGYNERDVIDPETKNIKLSGALHYKISKKLEALLMGYWATGNSVYTGNNRYVLKDIKIGQYKFELKHKDWFLRSYTTQENAGQAYGATVTTQYFNEAWKPSQNWYPEYIGNFVGARANGLTVEQAHAFARSKADIGRPQPGSAQFRNIFDSVRKVPIPNGGLFLEKSQLWMTEGQYDFTNKIKFVDIVVGASWKKYILDSDGTLFIDKPDDPITFSELGAYAQASKKIFRDRLSLSFAGRYDKNEDFKAHFTPRATALIKLAKDNNLRLSYQTAYRFPSTQQKYIRLDVGDYILLGGLPWVMDSMNVKTNPVVDASTGQPFVYKELKPESCRSFEFGYKGVINKRLLIDAYAYFGQYTDFLGRNALYQPGTGQVYSTVLNSTTKVNTHGYGLGFDYQLKKNYSIFFNAYSDLITNVPTGFQAYFNAPKYRLNAGFANTGLGENKRFGFNAVVHWQDAFMWDGELANGPVNAFTTIDAQVNYKFPKIGSMVKLGGTNIANHYYKNAFANPEMGGLYYVSFAYNILDKKE
jgi:outer membrane receptor protein involved in Fe transport